MTHAMRIAPLVVVLIFLASCSDSSVRHRTLLMNQAAQEEWKQKTLSHVQAINAFVDKGRKEGWEMAGTEPKEPNLQHLAEAAMAAVRHANSAAGGIETLRDLWPPAHAPLIPILEKQGQSIPVVCILDDGSIVARIGSHYQPGRTIHISGDTVSNVPDVGFFGRCPNRRFFGVAREAGIAILDGWRGPEVALCPWPTGREDLPVGFKVKTWDDVPNPSSIIPFPDGRKVLMVSEHGIYVLTEKTAHRLLPTKEQMREHFEWSAREHPKDEVSLYLSMEHGAVSRDGRLIAVGCQDSTHLIFNDHLELIGDVGNQSEYPHFAVFSADQRMIAFNSCHFYNGITVGVPVGLLPGLKTEAYETDEKTPILEDDSRVYAAVSRNDEFIIGNASGYIRAFDFSGKLRWQQFLGSSVGDIDVSQDGKTLVVSTYAGFLSIFRLDAGHQAPHQIGIGNHHEERRWIIWKDEPKPLIW